MSRKTSRYTSGVRKNRVVQRCRYNGGVGEENETFHFFPAFISLLRSLVQILWAKREAIYKREIGETPGRMKGARTKLTISKQGHC